MGVYDNNLNYNKNISSSSSSNFIDNYTKIIDDVKIIYDIEYCKSIDYNNSLKALCLDQYVNKDNINSKKPAITLIHGGGFGYGDKQQLLYIKMAMEFAHSGYAAYSINYTLKPPSDDCFDPQAVCDRATDDAELALNFLKRNYEALGIDKNKIIVSGDSAGAAIAVNLSFKNLCENNLAVCIDLWGGMPGNTGFNNPVFAGNINSSAMPTLIIHGNLIHVFHIMLGQILKIGLIV